MNSKILTFKEIVEKIKILKKKNKKIILCHGVFDLLHVGHIKHLKKAKEFGDKLIVTITPDIYVNKGPGRPVFNQNLRSESIAALDSVDFVVINNTITAVNPIRVIKPDIYCKGQDYKKASNDITGEIKNEIKEIKKIKSKIVFTDEITFSSSRLINKSTDFFHQNKKKLLIKLAKFLILKK